MLGGMLEAASEHESSALSLTLLAGNTPAGFAYARSEELAEGTWNLLALAVKPYLQGQGLGAELVSATEAALSDRNQRILIIDTSGTPDFAPVRTFYEKAGYVEEARIRDYWAPGDDKVTFWKRL